MTDHETETITGLPSAESGSKAPREPGAQTVTSESTAAGEAAVGEPTDDTSTMEHPGELSPPESTSASLASDVDSSSNEQIRTSGGLIGRRALLEREGEVAADFLESLLDICDLDGDLDVDVDGDRAAVSIVDSEEGRVPRRLVGPGGQVLDALQELTRLAVQTATGERSRLMLDIAGHRAERRAALVGLAQAAVERVNLGSAREALDPMTAFERKVVHDAVLAAGLVSESEGAEPRRYVVVLPG